jgi:hydrogenase expression/formation protein HypE
MDRPYRIKAVLFDFDGTLTRPGDIDFALIRERIGCPADAAVLEYIRNISNDLDRQDALAEVNVHEMAAASKAIPNSAAERVITDLAAMGVKVGVITRNTRMAIELALVNFKLTEIDSFDLVISRDDPILPKPDPDGILHASDIFGVPAEEILVVGDFVFDIDAGNRAGALSAFITNGEKAEVPEKSDFTIHCLADLLPIVQMGRPLQCGKLPQELLDSFLKEFDFSDPSVLNWPGVGEDTTAVAVKEEDVLVITSDPITFATDGIGEYAVLVNANDIATSGGTPRWLLTTLLFPVNTTPSEIHYIMSELATVCKRSSITLCGGHTEITDAVSRTVINGMMVGSVSRDRFLDKKDMRPGDQILLTKGVAIEGTALIARQFEKQLLGFGVDRDTIGRAKEFISRISVIEEAYIAASRDGVKSLHDITEGGLATALEELSIAGGYGIEVQVPRIPILVETEAVCLPFKIDPLGLIGSGSLLICCHPDASGPLQVDLEAAGIDTAHIGSVRSNEPGIVAMDGETILPWPRFAVDEITRLFR